MFYQFCVFILVLDRWRRIIAHHYWRWP